VSSGSTEGLNAVWGSSGTDVFAVGYFGAILHYDGNTWSTMPSETGDGLLWDVWGNSGSDVFAVGSGSSGGTILHYNGSTWTPMSNPLSGVSMVELTSVWGTSSSNVFAVGGGFNTDGIILHYDGSTWSSMTSGTREGLLGVWGISGSDVFAVGVNGTILHYDGNTWSPMENPLSGISSAGLHAVWGSSGSDVFAVSDYLGTILHYDGNTWSTMVSGTENYLSGVWGSSGSDVFAVGLGTILHYNGRAWSLMTSPTSEWLNNVWGSSGSDVFVVGYAGTVLHYGGEGCPLKTVLGKNNPDLHQLRAFRNEIVLKTDEGVQYTALYYKHGPELSDILAHHEELKEKATMLIQSILPAIGSLLAKRTVVIDEDTVQNSIELIDALTSLASPALAKDLSLFKQDMQNGVLFKTVKVKIQKY